MMIKSLCVRGFHYKHRLYSLFRWIEVFPTTPNTPFVFFLFFSSAEIEAKEACTWLRAAGFPQYAQLYEGKDPCETPPPTLPHHVAVIKIRSWCYNEKATFYSGNRGIIRQKLCCYFSDLWVFERLFFYHTNICRLLTEISKADLLILGS